jgi:YD repeat-containing protein
MKTIFSYTFYWFVFLITAAFVSGCLNRRSDDVVPETGCRLSKYSATVTSTGNSQTRKEEATYEYDQQGNLVRADSSWTESGDPAGNTANGLTKARYTYNGNGFLSTASSVITWQTKMSGTVNNAQRSSAASFTYTDGKVTGYTSTYTTFGGLQTTVTGTFEYDAAANLVKRTAVNTYTYDPAQVKEVPTYPNGLKRIWVYQNAQLTEYIEQVGTTEVRPYTIANGLVIREDRPAYFILYTYDPQNRLIKHEFHSQGKITYYYSQEWAEGKSAIESIPAFKGFPQIPAAFGKRGNLKKYDFYADIPGTGLSQLTSHTMTNQLNGQSFITGQISEQREMNPDRVLSRTALFTYTGCK